MAKESEITPFSGAGESTQSFKSPKIRRIASAFKWAGFVGFWVQLVLGVISTVVMLLAITNRTETSRPGTGFSLFCAACGLICLVVGIYFSFRYGKMATRFASNGGSRPKKTTALKTIQIGLVVSLVGMFLAIVGAQAIAGIVLSKILAFGQGEVFSANSNRKEFVNSLDLFIVQANTNIISAHFAGLASSLWLLNRVTK